MVIVVAVVVVIVVVVFVVVISNCIIIIVVLLLCGPNPTSVVPLKCCCFRMKFNDYLLHFYASKELHFNSPKLFS